MENKTIQGKTIKEWEEQYPLMSKIISTEEVFWTNPKYGKFADAIENISLSEDDVKDAEDRLNRFAPYIAKVFPETEKTDGIIESPIVPIPTMQKDMEKAYNQEIAGQLLLKCDSHLAISGSIKARGGIYEVLKHAEGLAIANNMLTTDDDYSIIDSDRFKEFFSKYSIAVGSTGNLGLSIGIMSAQLGFKVSVHMSADAKQWKKDLLRSRGASVIEYESDYSIAVEEGRKQAEADPNMHFIDDENSTDLFLGYAVAASRLKKQLEEMNVVVDEDHPLFVYLPCGVGGGPGGVAFGLKLVFKDHVHCFFAEPTHSPCMVIGLMTELHDLVSVQDFGIDNITDADGLAVGRASGFVGKTLENLMSGSYTVNDEEMYKLLSMLSDSENIQLEPSALAGMHGPMQFFRDEAGQKYIENNNLQNKIENVSHLVWGTGGSMVPTDEMKSYYDKGKEILASE
ncbi:D-serine ammonia-lyase [Sporosarcina jiandibaonis]|uniref:D-serine ammonia-lyase n=1 Tax=Sporosarcina jiandibaonis TaxID=2715535 RepID=UPI0015517F55|nr:D-serine ammonia-lyase [Sporosarcina jiandibaonis]